MFNCINTTSYNYFLLFQFINVCTAVLLLFITNMKNSLILNHNIKLYLFVLLWILSGLPLSIFFLIKIIFIFKINSMINVVQLIFVIINTIVLLIYFNWLITIDWRKTITTIQITYIKLLILSTFILMNFLFNILIFYYI